MNIDRTNRDRKGGHEHTPLRKGPWAGADMTVARRTIKRYDKRLLRRQHNKAINDGLAILDAEAFEREEEIRMADYWEREDSIFDTYPDELKDQDDGSYFDDPLYHCGDPECSVCDADARPAARVSLPPPLLMHAPFWTPNADFDVDKEHINIGDCGKTLGDLLRERASRQR